MKQNIIETVLGAIVLLVAFVFLIFGYSKSDVGSVNGYKVTADFTGTGGLNVGDSVQISGVKIGSVDKIELKPEDYRARVTMDVESFVKLPDDSSALISSEGLLGGKYMELQPGSSEDMLKDGGHIEYTQAPQNLEQLLGKFIFSMGDTKKAEGDDASATTPAPAPSAPSNTPPVEY